MVGKAYFGALVVVDKNTPVKLNAAEIIEYEWFPSNQFETIIKNNPKQKQNILIAGWNKLMVQA